MKIIELGSKQNLKGKAGNLNRLYHDFSIARGVIIPNEVFQEFINQNHISLLEKNIQEKIKHGKLEIENLIEYLKKNKYRNVIVRSSVSLEDQNHYSFSGQFDSFPNTKIEEKNNNLSPKANPRAFCQDKTAYGIGSKQPFFHSKNLR